MHRCVCSSMATTDNPCVRVSFEKGDIYLHILDCHLHRNRQNKDLDINKTNYLPCSLTEMNQSEIAVEDGERS